MVINGQGQPRLIVIDVTHTVANPIASITLPYCKKLTTIREPVQTIHGVQSGFLSSADGWMYTFVLDYSDFLDGQTLVDSVTAFQLAQFSQQSAQGVFSVSAKRLILIPRIDAPELQYGVIFNKPFEESMIYGQGHADIIFEFLGIDIEPSVVLQKFGYGSHYGCKNADGTNYTPGYGTTI